MTKCLFCDFDNEELIEEGEHCYARRDGYPVSEHHTLIIPKRHVASYFDLSEEEVLDMFRMTRLMKQRIEALDSTVGGFNAGVNAGVKAAYCAVQRLNSLFHQTGHPEHIKHLLFREVKVRRDVTLWDDERVVL